VSCVPLTVGTEFDSAVVIALLGPWCVSKNDDEFDVYTKIVDGRDVQDRVEV
jgi:hypothetical protein